MLNFPIVTQIIVMCSGALPQIDGRAQKPIFWVPDPPLTPPTHQKDLAGPNHMGTIDIRPKRVTQLIVIFNFDPRGRQPAPRIKIKVRVYSFLVCTIF